MIDCISEPTIAYYFEGKSQTSELQSLRRKFQNQQGRLQEILVCLDVGMTYLHDHNQLKEYFTVSQHSIAETHS